MADAKVTDNGTIIDAPEGFERLRGKNIHEILSGGKSLKEKIEIAKGLTGAKSVDIVDQFGNLVDEV